MKQLSCILLSFVFFLTAFSLPTAAFAVQVDVSARHAAMYEPVTNTFLYVKNGDSRAPMASTTKIMTALVAIENGNLDDTVKIREEYCGIEGSSIYMVPGEELSLKELLYALLLQSANDAATAIAGHIADSQEQFAEMMNARAAALGLQNTHFTNPHGLDHEDHYTSACDLARIAAAAMENATFREIASTRKYNIPGRDGGIRVLVNHNKLLRMYDHATGIKTGFTKKSGRCLVGAAEKDGLTFITVTLDAPNDWNDHIRLFEAGFQAMHNRLLCDAGQFVYELPVIGQGHLYAHCTNTEPLYAILPQNAPSPKVVLDLPHFLLGNEKPGSVIGTIRFQYQNNIIAQAPLVLQDKTR